MDYSYREHWWSPMDSTAEMRRLATHSAETCHGTVCGGETLQRQLREDQREDLPVTGNQAGERGHGWQVHVRLNT
jgi:hypothetical protein